MMWNNGEWWQFGMGYGFHWIFMVAFWGLVIWAVVALIRNVRRRGGSGEEPAQAILERRFARGELNSTEFKKMTQTLANAGK